MINNKKITVRKDELPLELEVLGNNGESVTYSIEPAGKHKVGARLGTICERSKLKVKSQSQPITMY